MINKYVLIIIIISIFYLEIFVYNKCLSSYEKDINKFYEKKKFDADSDPDSSYETYKCKNSWINSENENYIYMEETKECINTCDGYLYMNGNENICYFFNS